MQTGRINFGVYCSMLPEMGSIFCGLGFCMCLAFFVLFGWFGLFVFLGKILPSQLLLCVRVFHLHVTLTDIRNFP